MQFTIAVINPSQNELWQLHKRGCRDLSNGRTRNIESLVEIEAESVQAAREQWIDEELQSMGYEVDGVELRAMPCCKN